MKIFMTTTALIPTLMKALEQLSLDAYIAVGGTGLWQA